MLAGLCLAEPLIAKYKAGQSMKVLVLGTGTGVLTMFLRQHFAISLDSITTVEIDGDILRLAKDHFGFDPETTDKLVSVEADAYNYVMGMPDQYDMIFFDVNYEEEGNKGVSPPPKYFEPDFMN